MSDKITEMPQIRFDGYTDAWEPQKYADLLDKKDGIRRGPFGSALKKDFFVPESDYVVYEQQNAIYDRYNTRYNITKEKFDELHHFVVNPGDFIMSGAGTIGRISRVPEDIRQGVFNQALIRMKIDEEVTDSEFFLQWMRSNDMQRKLTGANPGSAMVNLVPMTEVKEWDVIVPKKAEQEKIGQLFKIIEDLITLHQRKYDLLAETKQSYLKKLFPKDGKDKPEIRFDGFTHVWEHRSLGDLAEVKTGFPFKNEDFVDNGKYLVITNGNIQNDMYYVDGSVGNRITDVSDQVKEQYYLNVGDILVTMDGTVGRTAKVVKNDQILAQRVGRLIAHDDNEFLYQWLNTGKFFSDMTKVSHGGTIKHISLKEISDYKAYVPKEKGEQNKIGAFFKVLDTSITLHQHQLNSFKTFKQTLLQLMFV